MSVRRLGLVASLVALGCGSTGVGNPETEPISLALVSDDDVEPTGEVDAAAAMDAGGDIDGAIDAGADAEPAMDAGPDAELVLDAGADLPRDSVVHAVVVLGELRWLPCDARRAPVVVPGPFVVDLKVPRAMPKIATVQAPPGGFCGLDAPLAPAQAPAALSGKSLFFDGFRSDGVFFLLYANMAATLRMRPRPGVVWSGKDTPAVLWAMRPRRWLHAAELAGAETSPWDGRPRAIIIDINRHPALYLAVRARLAGRSTLYFDKNGNGLLDPEERVNAIIGEGTDNAD
jgi:hypothetical protein